MKHIFFRYSNDSRIKY